ncbi:MAG: carboxypeptidase regulatory-like domain-containing protein, partial [Planctomycetes bacterium]|nr:carboxypeptidase regulatory-like domain-containing protein [Planctomycetota bacterium]
RFVPLEESPTGTAIPIEGGASRVVPEVAMQSDSDGNYTGRALLPSEPLTEVVLEVRHPLHQRVTRVAEVPADADEWDENFQLQPGYRVHGVVFTSDRTEPASGMLVVATPYDSTRSGFLADLGARAVSEGTVDAEGRFNLLGLPPGEYRVSARNNGSSFVTMSAQKSPTVGLSAEQPEAEVNLLVELGGAVYGRVTDRTGTPVSGAKMGLLPKDFMKAAMGGGESFAMLEQDRVRTDDHGDYAIHGVKLGVAWRLIVGADGYAAPDPESVKLTLEEREARRDIELSEGGSISGVVVDADEQLVSDVTVRILPDIAALMSGELNPAVFEVTSGTDDQGRFTLAHLPAGEYRIGAGDELALNPFSGGSSVTVVPLGEEEHVVDVTVTLITGADLPTTADETDETGIASGRVIDTHGDPVPDAFVQVIGMKAPMPVMRSGKTDENGEFSIIGVGETVTQIEVSHPGYGKTTLRSLGTNTEGLTIELARNGSIAGVVRTPSGEFPSAFNVGYRRARSEPATDYLEEIQNMAEGAGRSQTSVTNSTDGSFELPDVPAGSLEIVVSSAGFARTISDVVIVEPGRRTSGVVVTLTRGAWISGKVVDPTGVPLEGATVALRETRGELDKAMAAYMPAFLQNAPTATTDDRGEYAFNAVPHGRYTIIAQHDAFAPSDTLELTVDADEERVIPTLAVSAGGKIVGRIVDAEGAPKSGLIVQLMSAVSSMQSGTVDGEGRFEFSSLKPGDYSVFIMDMAAVQGGKMKLKTRHVTISSDETEEVEIAYGRGHKVFGVIEGLGKVSSMQQIQILRPGAPSSADLDPMDPTSQMGLMKYLAGMAMVDADGNFEIDDLEPGTYIVEVPRLPENPTDLQSYRTSDRTPHYRKELEVKDRDVELRIRAK